MTQAQPEEPDPLVGKTIGSYRILKVLGKGGMGAVYLAEHPIINSQVAIKFLHPQYAADQKVVDRFFNEARAVNVIGHPNILKILDLNVTEDRRHYFVMEFLHGRPLTKLLRKGGLGLDVAGPILLQCCAALEAAHGRGIVHRDLKPDNVYLVSHLGRGNFVKVVDFGIAKLTDVGDPGSGRTQTGTVMGTPAYMSPEQATGDTHAIDGRSDVYSLGVMMFQMATGRLPFEGNTFGKLLIAQVQQQPPAPRSIAPSIPEQWERIILRTLEKDPAARPQGMAELADELHACMQELGIPAELPLDDGAPADGPDAARVPSDPGRRRGYVSGPKITPPARRASKPSMPATAGPAVEPARASVNTGPRSLPPARTETKRKTGLFIGAAVAAVAAIALGGMYAGGAFDESAAGAPREKPRPAAVAASAAPAPAPAVPVEAPAAEPRHELPAPAPAEANSAGPPAAVETKTPEPPAAVETKQPEPSAQPAAKQRRARAAAAPAPEPAPAVRISAVSDPPGADVIARWDGGEKRGKAPLQFDAPRGARVKLGFSLRGYSPSEEEITADAPRTVTSELVQLLGD